MNNEEPAVKPHITNAMTSQGGKIFDVVRPGKTLASPTSRPVIVGHKPPVKDDQFVPANESHLSGVEDADADQQLMTHTSSSDTAIHPSAAFAQEMSEVAVPPSDEAAAAPNAMNNAPAIHNEPEPAALDLPVSSESEPQKASPESLAVAEVVSPPEDQTATGDQDQATGTPVVTQDDLKQAAPTDDQVVTNTSAPLLDHAVVSHHKQPARWWEVVLAILLVIIIIGVALNFLLDAEVIKTSLNIPHTHLIGK